MKVSRAGKHRIRARTPGSEGSRLAAASISDVNRLWEFLHARAVEIHVADHLRERIERGDKLRVKLGLDPTAPDLHVGHLVVLDVLRAFQDHGHTVVPIVGDFTGLIGDPSGRSETRPMLSREQIDANAKTYFDQIFKVLDPDKTEIHGNAEWSLPLSAADVLRLLGKATLQQVLAREDFATRLKEGTPIGAHEILYPFMQGYDSVPIHADVEIGGTDQLFNLLFAREIQRAYGQEPEDIMVFPLLEGLDGKQKMSKSLGNYIGLTEPPEEIYGKAMSIPDNLTERYLRLVSGMPADKVAEMLKLPPRDAKAALAKQLVRRLHNDEAAQAAEADFDRKFRQRTLPDEIPEKGTSSSDVIDALVETGFARSRGEARRLLDQGGVRINGDKATAVTRLNDGDVLQKGRREFVRVRVG
jgi:tyrosyl-tRNA synthetase